MKFAVAAFVAAAVFAPAVSAAAPADDVPTKEEIDKGEAAYQVAYKPLPDAQKNILAKYEKPFVHTIFTTVQFRGMLHQLAYCADTKGNPIEDDPARYKTLYDKHVARESAKVQVKKDKLLAERRAATSSFIDQTLVDHHYRWVMLQRYDVSISAMKIRADEGGWFKTVDCNALAKWLTDEVG